MAKVTWLFTLDNKKNELILDHNFWTTRQIATLNGKVVFDATPLNNLENVYTFPYGDHEFKVVIGRRYLVIVTEYELYIDGRKIKPVSEVGN